MRWTVFHDLIRRPGSLLLAISLVGCADTAEDSGPMVIAQPEGGMGNEMSCFDGDSRCAGTDHQICNGGFWVLTTSTECGAMAPDDACLQAAASNSYIGCEYWPVDLDNAIEVLQAQTLGGGCRGGRGNPRNDIPVCYSFDLQATGGLCEYGGVCPEPFECAPTGPSCVLDAQGSPFAVVVSNPDAERAVSITLSDASGHEHTQEIPAGAVVSLFPQQLGFTDRSLDYSGISANAYRLRSQRPIIAYQFNPLNNVDVFSNDGSLLIPSHAYDDFYIGLTLPTLARRRPGTQTTNDYNSYMTVVASQPGTTRVVVTPSAQVRAGDQVPELAPGQVTTFELQQFEVLNLEAAAGGDMSGTQVRSEDGTAFGVFVGHEATVIATESVPAMSRCCADHIEEQMFPLSTWGSDYAIARSASRGVDEPDLLRIMAQRMGTSIIFDPPPASGNCGVLGRGEFCDVRIQQDTRVTGTEPILVGHFLQSTNGQAGDPALALAVPFEQFRTDYTFLIPEEYDQQYISVVAPEGATLSLDGVDVSDQLDSSFGGFFAGGRIEVEPGQHTLDCPSQCGLIVYGYSRAVSYLFAGGLDLERITVP